MSAKTKALEALAAALATALSDRVNSPEATAADFNVVRQFLKDNGVQFGDANSKPIKNLVESLPFAGEDHEDVHPFKN